MLFFIFFVLRGYQAASFFGSDSDYDNQNDPSIWNRRVWIDDVIDWMIGWDEKGGNPDSVVPVASPEISFEKDYELKSILLECIKNGYWDLFEEIQFYDLKDWRHIPDIKDLIVEMVSGPSIIILDLFLNDNRIKLDDRISKADQIFFHYRNPLRYIAQAFDCENLGNYSEDSCFGFTRAIHIYRIRRQIPAEWYDLSIPNKFTHEQCESVEARFFMTLLAVNRRVPQSVVKSVLKDTNICVDPVPLGFLLNERLPDLMRDRSYEGFHELLNELLHKSLKISLHALADFRKNVFFFEVIMDLERYEVILPKVNTKADEVCKAKLKEILNRK